MRDRSIVVDLLKVSVESIDASGMGMITPVMRALLCCNSDFKSRISIQNGFVAVRPPPVIGESVCIPLARKGAAVRGASFSLGRLRT